MYLVVSVWEALPEKAEQFEAASAPVRDLLRQQPGVVMVEAFKSGDHYVAVHGYADEAAYHRTVTYADGPFVKLIEEKRLEDYGRWVSSEKGQTIE
jgi:hypothetical protein